MQLFQSPLFIFLSFLFLFSCQPADRSPTDTLIVGIEAAPSTLDPRLAADPISAKITGLLHRGLFRLTERFELVPDLAESVEEIKENPDRPRFRFHLRSGVTFPDGHEIGANDVKFTLESIQDPSLSSPFREMMSRIEKIEVVDPKTFEITLKEPFVPFSSVLTIGIVPSGTRPPEMGTGPFVLQSFDQGQILLIRKSDRKKILFKVIPDGDLRVMELKNHKIDLLQNNMSSVLLDSLRHEKGFVVERTEGINMSYLGINLRQGPLQKTEVRQAIAHALDLPAIVGYRMSNLVPVSTGILAPVHWAYEGGVKTYPYDPKKARELLDKAGYPDPDGPGPASRFSLTYSTLTQKDRIGLARLITRYLGEVGIGVRIFPLEWGTFFQNIDTGRFDLYSHLWRGVTEPDIYYSLFHSSQRPPHGVNRGGYANPVMDQLTEAGRKTADQAERKKIYAEVQKISAEDLPIIPLWHEDNFAVFSKRVKGVRLRPNGSFEWAEEVYKE